MTASPTNNIYRADGVKVHKDFTINWETINTEYIDGFVYTSKYTLKLAQALAVDNPQTREAFTARQEETFELAERLIDRTIPPQVIQSSPNFFPTAEGFYDFENFKYIYQYKDHLGNVRLSYSWDSSEDALAIEDSNDYYPFGLNFIYSSGRQPPRYSPSTTFRNYKYNGKELQETGMYDYGARMYMPDIGRWGVVDELAEKFSRHSPYNYVVNDPINGIDPDGRDVIFLADSKAVPLAGHGAVIVGNERDGWYYYSMNGTGKGSSPYGDAKNADVGTPLGKGLSPKEAMVAANKVNPDEEHHYDKFVTVKTTKEEDVKIKAAAAKAANAEKYCVIGQSCATVMLDSLNKIINIRSNNAWYVPKVRDPAPNNIMDYFNKEKGGGINFLNRFILPADKEIQTRKIGKLEVGPVIPEGVDNNKTQLP